MNWIAQVLAVVVGVIVIVVGALESFQFRNPRYYKLFLIREQDWDAVRLWVVNLGFYNMVLGLGILAGVVVVNVGDVTVGATMVIFGCAVHVIQGVVLGVTEHKLISSGVSQSVPPLLGILLAAFLPA
jgi:putative membrane protein